MPGAGRTIRQATLTMRIDTIYHTGFVVADLDRALAFYTDTLGLTVERAPFESSSDWLAQVVGYEKVRMRIAFVGPGDGHVIELLQYIEPHGELRSDQHDRNRPGSAHAAFVVDHVAAWRATLEAAGVSCFGPVEERDEPYPAARLAIYFQDPDGNWLEMVQRDPAPST